MTRHKCYMASFVIFIKDNKVCLMRRQGTDHMCGKMSLPAGHVDPGETYKEAAIREMKEEACVDLKPEELEFCVVEHCPDHNYVNTYFICRDWEGDVCIGEPHKCDEIEWYSLDDLPEDTVPYVRKVLENLDKKYQERRGS